MPFPKQPLRDEERVMPAVPARESLKQEAIASWTAYQATGLHLTGDEVAAWLKTWDAEAEAAPPECHA